MKNNKEIIIRYHAIDEFITRVSTHQSINEKVATQRIKAIVEKGKIVSARPGDAYEIMYEGISLVCKVKETKIFVITCLGDKKYRAWAKKTEILPRYRPRKVC